jgi:hypothetical protein
MIINLSNKALTPAQIAAGASDLPSATRAHLIVLLDKALAVSPLSASDGILYGEVQAPNLAAVCHEIATIVSSLGDDDTDQVPFYALIDGPGWFTRPLEDALMDYGDGFIACQSFAEELTV